MVRPRMIITRGRPGRNGRRRRGSPARRHGQQVQRPGQQDEPPGGHPVQSFAPRRSSTANSSVNRGWAAMLMAELPNWPDDQESGRGGIDRGFGRAEHDGDQHDVDPLNGDLGQVGHGPRRGEPPEAAHGRGGHPHARLTSPLCPAGPEVADRCRLPVARPHGDRAAHCPAGPRAAARMRCAAGAGPGAARSTPQPPRAGRPPPTRGRAGPRSPRPPRPPPRSTGRLTARSCPARRWAAYRGSPGWHRAGCRTAPRTAGPAPGSGWRSPAWLGQRRHARGGRGAGNAPAARRTAAGPRPRSPRRRRPG